MKGLIHLVVGARPNFVKAFPVYKALKNNKKFGVEVVYTMQHQRQQMSLDFASRIGLPSQGLMLKNTQPMGGIAQTSSIMRQYGEVLESRKPNWTIVFGDISSALACAYASKTCGVRVAHIESGLRCRNIFMVEEINRRAIDSISDFKWTTLPSATTNLISEGHNPNTVSEVGNTMIDTMRMLMPTILNSRILMKLGLKSQEYLLLTFHRKENTSDKDILIDLIESLKQLPQSLKIVFSVHPRTLQKINEWKLLNSLYSSKNILVIDPLDYTEFINLLLNSCLVITDSGGVQEEATALGLKSLIVRGETERIETLESGFSELIDLPNLNERVRQLTSSFTKKREVHQSQTFNLWDGHAAERILRDVMENF